MANQYAVVGTVSSVYVNEKSAGNEYAIVPAVFLGEPTVAGAVSGTLAATEAQDTVAIVGSYGASGILLSTEAQDTAVITASYGATGTLAANEAADTAAFTGSFVGVASGILVAVEAQDTAAFTGSYAGVPTGTLAATENADIAMMVANYIPPAVVDIVGELHFGRPAWIKRRW